MNDSGSEEMMGQVVEMVYMREYSHCFPKRETQIPVPGLFPVILIRINAVGAKTVHTLLRGLSDCGC